MEADREWTSGPGSMPENRGLGATFAAMLCRDRSATVAHLGDCRAHQIRAGHIVRMTADHLHELDPRIVVRFIPGGSTPEISEWEILPQDVLLLTASIHRALSDAQIEDVVRREREPGRIPDRLVRLALDRGATDDVIACAVSVRS